MKEEPLQPLAITPPDPTIGQMFAAVLSKGNAADNADAIKTLAELRWKEQAMNAEKEFATAFSKLQSEVKTVKATFAVPDKNGNLKFRVAKFEDVMAQLNPLLLGNRFTLGFEQNYESGLPLRITVAAILQHTPSGHKTRTPFTVRVGDGPPGCSDFQADGAASSYAKMRALCACLNIIIDRAEEDARSLGKPISEGQAMSIMSRVTALNLTPSKETSFMKWAGVVVEGPATIGDYRKIMDAKFKPIETWLAEQEKKGVAK